MNFLRLLFHRCCRHEMHTSYKAEPGKWGKWMWMMCCKCGQRDEQFFPAVACKAKP